MSLTKFVLSVIAEVHKNVTVFNMRAFIEMHQLPVLNNDVRLFAVNFRTFLRRNPAKYAPSSPVIPVINALFRILHFASSYS